MAFYVKKKLNGKWYPIAVRKGRPYTTDDVAERLSLISTVSRGDTYAVLANLGDVLATMMSAGRSVKLMGIGTFYYTCCAEGTGVDTREEVGTNQITSVKVRFIPEYERGQRKQVTGRTLIDPNLEWVDAEEL
ncbi:MAG: DNA-binding protein [Bacteroides sp.]|nr:DNA-binding protein [Bacteroides sp.]